MDKFAVLREIFLVENVREKIVQHKLIVTEEQLLFCISKKNYNLKNELNLSHQTISKYIKILFPDKPKTTSKLCIYLLGKYDYKHCPKCQEVLEIELFYANSSHKDNLSSYCKQCQLNAEKPTSTSRASKYRASKLKRTPKWVSIEEADKIAEFYRNCPPSYHVDHIIPLQGDCVSGLHILANLQYLSAADNLSKSNKFTPL